MTEKTKIRWSKLILVASLGLNLVVGGLVLGAWANGPKRGDGGARPSSFSAGPFGRALTKEDRRLMGDQFRKSPEARERLGRGRGEMRKIGLEVVAVLRADPLDTTALDGLFDRQAQLGVDLQNMGRQALLDRIIAMTPEDRASFADRLEKGVKRGRKRKKD